MKKILTMGVAALFVLGACGVDKEGTGDKLVSDLEKASGSTYTAEQKTCLKDLIKGMSDAEITALSENKASADAQAEFGTNVAACVSGDTATADTSTGDSTGDTVAEESTDTTVGS